MTYTPLQQRHIYLYVLVLSLLSMMGLTIITPALPFISGSFGVRGEGAWAILTAFAAPGIIMVVLAGVLSDRYGRKKVLAVCLALFCIGGVGCALAPTYGLFLFFRVIQGIGSGPLGSLNATLIADTFAPCYRPRYYGMIGIIAALSTAIFPFIGGFLTEWSWRWTFGLSILGLPALLYLYRIPLKQGSPQERPAEQLRLFRRFLANKEVSMLLLFEILVGASLYGPVNTYFPLLCDHMFGASPSLLGTITMCGSLGILLSGLLVGWLTVRYAYRTLMVFCGVLLLVAYLLFLWLPQLWLLVIPLLLHGFGYSLVSPILKTRLSVLASEDTIGAVLSLNGVAFRLSQAVAPALCGLFWTGLGVYGPFWLGLLLSLGVLVLALRVLPAGVLTAQLPTR